MARTTLLTTPPTNTLTAKEQEARREFYSSVGQAISAWATMEGAIVKIAARLMGTTDPKAGLVFYSMNFTQWLPVVTDLFALEPTLKKQRTAWNRAYEKLRAMNNTRVRLAHHTTLGTQFGEPVTLRPSPMDARSKSKASTPLTQKEIVAFTGEIVDTFKKLITLYEEVRSPSAV